MRTKLMILAVPALLLSSAAMPAQYGNGNRNGFYNGVQQGGRSANYGDDRYHHGDNYNNGYQHQGGIGPGKGALIGGVGGAALGAAFGGGLKGSLIGGAAGAGIGAVAGKEHQNHERYNNGYYGR